LMNCKQLTIEQRIEIYILLKAGFNQTKITRLVGFSKLTVSREIRRNTGFKSYRPKQANQRALDRRQNADKYVRFADEVKADVKKYLKQDWSPKQISSRLQKNNKPAVSHETIYQFVIDGQKDSGELYKHLRL